MQYIFDYPFKNKFDLLAAFVNNLNRKSMGSIIITVFLEIIPSPEDEKMALFVRGGLFEDDT